ncbi:MAG: DUF5615 family PIN-like protein [Spirochaetota bacterium]
MRVKLDENLGTRGVQIFQKHGHDVASVAGRGLQSSSDRDLIRVCGQEDRCLVTLDASSLVGAVHLFHLATRFSITAYDAAYLALAEITGASILTLDRRLQDAAVELGIAHPSSVSTES